MDIAEKGGKDVSGEYKVYLGFFLPAFCTWSTGSGKGLLQHVRMGSLNMLNAYDGGGVENMLSQKENVR